MKLNVRAFALTCATLWGFGLFAGTLWILLYYRINGITPVDETPFIGLIYWGYSVTTSGAFIGLVWGFLDGLIGGAIFAWLYNKLTGPATA